MLRLVGSTPTRNTFNEIWGRMQNNFFVAYSSETIAIDKVTSQSIRKIDVWTLIGSFPTILKLGVT